MSWRGRNFPEILRLKWLAGLLATEKMLSATRTTGKPAQPPPAHPRGPRGVQRLSPRAELGCWLCSHVSLCFFIHQFGHILITLTPSLFHSRTQGSIHSVIHAVSHSLPLSPPPAPDGPLTDSTASPPAPGGMGMVFPAGRFG